MMRRTAPHVEAAKGASTPSSPRRQSEVLRIRRRGSIQALGGIGLWGRAARGYAEACLGSRRPTRAIARARE